MQRGVENGRVVSYPHGVSGQRAVRHALANFPYVVCYCDVGRLISEYCAVHVYQLSV